MWAASPQQLLRNSLRNKAKSLRHPPGLRSKTDWSTFQLYNLNAGPESTFMFKSNQKASIQVIPDYVHFNHFLNW